MRNGRGPLAVALLGVLLGASPAHSLETVGFDDLACDDVYVVTVLSARRYASRGMLIFSNDDNGARAYCVADPSTPSNPNGAMVRAQDFVTPPMLIVRFVDPQTGLRATVDYVSFEVRGETSSTPWDAYVFDQNFHLLDTVRSEAHGTRIEFARDASDIRTLVFAPRSNRRLLDEVTFSEPRPVPPPVPGARLEYIAMHQAEGVSGDGSTVVGSLWGRPARWTLEGGVEILTTVAGTARAASTDGSVIAVEMQYGNEPVWRPFRWTGPGRGDLLGFPFPNTEEITLSAMSGDGAYMVGTARARPTPEARHVYSVAFLWNALRGFSTPSEVDDPNAMRSLAGVSTDGRIFAGTRTLNFEQVAIRWTEAAGEQLLGALGGARGWSLGGAISADGSTIVGTADSATGSQAFRWTAETGMVGLGFPRSDSLHTIANDVSGDGSVVVGRSAEVDDGVVAFVWDARNGIRDLDALTRERYGLDPGPLPLSVATAISDDGRTIVGWENAGGTWRLLLPPANRPPIADAGADQTVECTAAEAAVVALDGSASEDPDGDPIEFAWASASGDVSGAMPSIALPLGEHDVELTVSDDRGGIGTDETRVAVIDSSPPQMAVRRVTPPSLWPPNHKLVAVRVAVDAADACTAGVACRIVGVALERGGSLDPEDVVITGDLAVELRATRKGRRPRVYRLELACTDASGNVATSSVGVPVGRPRASARAPWFATRHRSAPKRARP